jgi:hypothetical protein
LLELGTIAGSRALFGNSADGESQPAESQSDEPLAVNRPADLVAISLDHAASSDPLEALWDERNPIIGTMCGGMWCYGGFA